MPDAAPTDAEARLRAALRADPPAGVAALDAPAREQLAALIDSARRRQAESLVASFETAVRHVPFPARKLVRKVLLG